MLKIRLTLVQWRAKVPQGGERAGTDVPREGRTIALNATGEDRSRNPRIDRSIGGFSLVEMLIVIGLLTIIATIAHPTVQSVYGRWTVGRAADKFITNYGLARSAAMRYGRLSRLQLDATSGVVWIAVDTGLAGAGDTMAVEQPLDLGDLGVELTATRSVFCFDPRGIPGRGPGCAETPATVTFYRGDIARTVNITSGGRIGR